MTDQTSKAIKEVIQKLRKGGIDIRNEPIIVIQNMSLGISGREGISRGNSKQLTKSMSEPERFQGLIHRMADTKTVILLFSSASLCARAERQRQMSIAL